MSFEWDDAKAHGNARKHDVAFEDAATVFLDAQGLDGRDLAHSASEPRWLRLGRAADGRILMVAYTRRTGRYGEHIRIISARRASRRERAAYASGD